MKALLAALLLLAIPATATADTLIGQEQTAHSGWAVAGDLEIAQTFFAPASVRVRDIELMLRRDDYMNAPLIVQLVDGIWPSGVVKRTATIPIEAVPTTEGWVPVRFSSGLRLVPGRHYSIVISAPGLGNDSEDLYTWFGAPGVRPYDSPYQLGFAVRSDHNPEDQFLTLGDFDFAFRVGS